MADPNQFDVARKRAAQSEKAALQTNRDTIRRRAAARGNLNAGSTIKQQSLAADESQKRLTNANEGINAAEQVENRRIREVAEGREFARGEREAGQSFAANQSALARRLQAKQFGMSHGLATDQFGFAKGQAALQNKLARDQFGFAKDQAAFGNEMARENLGLQKASQAFAESSFNKQFKFQQDEFAQNKLTNTVNTIMSAYNSGIPKEQIEALAALIQGDPEIASLFIQGGDEYNRRKAGEKAGGAPVKSYGARPGGFDPNTQWIDGQGRIRNK